MFLALAVIIMVLYFFCGLTCAISASKQNLTFSVRVKALVQPSLFYQIKLYPCPQIMALKIASVLTLFQQRNAPTKRKTYFLYYKEEICFL